MSMQTNIIMAKSDAINKLKRFRLREYTVIPYSKKWYHYYCSTDLRYLQ